MTTSSENLSATRPATSPEPEGLESVGPPHLSPEHEALLGEAGAAAGLARACQSITVGAIEGLRDRIAAAGRAADRNVAANGPDAPGAGAPDTAVVSAQNVHRAEQRLTDLVADLRRDNQVEPSGVVKPVGGYAVYNRCRETVLDLHYGWHFAAVSAAWNSKRDPSGALECLRLLTDILYDLESFSAQATRCYLSIWYPDM